MEKQVIEYGGIPVGIAVQDNQAYRFIAVKFHVIDLDERRFPTIAQLKGVIRDHLMGQRRVA